ncbi:Ankyrin repeat-containing protein [Globisporangium polare]
MAGARRDAASDDAELEEFLAKEELESDAKQQKHKKKKQQRASADDDEEPKLFMELSWSAQRKIGTKEPALRQVEGDSVKQRLRSYRCSIFFHIHSKLDHNGYLLHQLRMNKQDPNGKDEKGRTALHYACRFGAETAARTLVYEEATIDDPDLDMRWTPLHYAVMGGHEKVVERLIEKAPVRRITINRKDKHGMTPLMLACGEDHADIARLLLRKKAFIDEADEDGWSALHYAAVNDSALAAEVLVQYDVSLKQRTYATNETALEMAERLRSHLVAILLYEVTYRKF